MGHIQTNFRSHLCNQNIVRPANQISVKLDIFDMCCFTYLEREATQLCSLPKIKELLEKLAELCHFIHSMGKNVKTEKTAVKHWRSSFVCKTWKYCM